MEEFILKAVYQYYPKGISNVTDFEEYSKSSENKRLHSTINSRYSEISDSNSFNRLMDEFRHHEFTKNIQDKTSLNFDRCINLNIEFVIGGNQLISVFISLSLLLPYYVVYVKENEINLNPYKWLTLPRRNKTLEESNFKDDIDSICSIIEKNTVYEKFPDNMLYEIIPDLSYQDNPIGSFTFFNAFFSDEKL